MPYVADLHTHSRFAGACSPQLTIQNLAKWAHLKGIDLLGTGDCLHPAWLEEMKRLLQPLPSGFYEHGGTKFVISTEVACNYSQNGKGRRIHILLYLSSINAAERLSNEMKNRGINIGYEGRPMIGLSAPQLCEVVFSIDPKAIIIPAHIWTPWFGMYGSKSGFDFFGECFGQFSEKIYAVETGLSSEPSMNWRVADLDKKTIVSFSDLHSLPRLGREVTLFDGEFSYDGLIEALRDQKVIGTIEFYPEEGKYHYSGHRKCGIVYDEKQVLEFGVICPVCKKELTEGVMPRVEELSTRTIDDLKLKKENGIIKSETFSDRPGFRMLVQLEEIIAEAIGKEVKTKTVQEKYEHMVTTIDGELKILTKTPIDLISMVAGERIAQGVKKVREGDITIEPGFDNTYGKVSIWSDEDERDEIPLL
jgi:uncharacterized protein (TIGR00375 family)